MSAKTLLVKKHSFQRTILASSIIALWTNGASAAFDSFNEMEWSSNNKGLGGIILQLDSSINENHLNINDVVNLIYNNEGGGILLNLFMV